MNIVQYPVHIVGYPRVDPGEAPDTATLGPEGDDPPLYVALAPGPHVTRVHERPPRVPTARVLVLLAAGAQLPVVYFGSPKKEKNYNKPIY